MTQMELESITPSEINQTKENTVMFYTCGKIKQLSKKQKQILKITMGKGVTSEMGKGGQPYGDGQKLVLRYHVAQLS